MSSYRKPEVQHDLPKITKIKRICFFLTNIGQKSLIMFISSCFNNYSIELKKKSEIKKISYATSGIRTRNPWSLGVRNTCAIGCAKETAENVFKSSVIHQHQHLAFLSQCVYRLEKN